MFVTEVLHLLNGDLPSKNKHTYLPAPSPPLAALLSHFKGINLHLGSKEVILASCGMYYPVATKLRSHCTLGMKVKGRMRIRGRKGKRGRERRDLQSS